MSEIKLFKMTLLKEWFTRSEDFTVIVLGPSVWFQYLSITGREALFRGLGEGNNDYSRKLNAYSNHREFTVH